MLFKKEEPNMCFCVPHVLVAFTRDINVSGSCRAHWRSLCSRPNLHRRATCQQSQPLLSTSSHWLPRRSCRRSAETREGIVLRTLLEMTNSLGVQSESVELDICRNKERTGRVISERRWFLQPWKRQKRLAGFCSRRGNSRLKEIVPGLKLYYGLYNSKRPEVISRAMQGQLNFLPLRPCDYFSFSGPHQPEQSAKTNLWVFIITLQPPDSICPTCRESVDKQRCAYYCCFFHLQVIWNGSHVVWQRAGDGPLLDDNLNGGGNAAGHKNKP